MCSVCDTWRDGAGRDAVGRRVAAVGESGQPYALSRWTSFQRWPTRTITWSAATRDFTGPDPRQPHISGSPTSSDLELVRQAFAVWGAAANVDFREVADSPEAGIRIGMGSNRSLGTRGGTLAYAGTYSLGLNRLRSVIVMDAAESWTPTHYFNVVLHEIGHAMGLSHSSVGGAVMYPTYAWDSTSIRSRLHQDDLDGIKALFPPSSPGSPSSATFSSSLVLLGDLTALSEPISTVGRVEDDSGQYYNFTLTAPRRVYFELRNLTADADLYLVSLENSTVTILAQSIRGGVAVDTLSPTLEAGSYYVLVNAYADGGIDYQLHVSQSQEGIPPAEGETRQTARNLGDLTSLASASEHSGTVNRDSNDAYYRRFTLTAARTMRFELRNLSADADLYLESSIGTVLAQSTQSSASDDTIVHTLEAGTYYVRVDAYAAGTIDYQLRLSQEGSPPVVSPPTEGETRQTAHDLGDLTSLASAVRSRARSTVTGNDDDYRRFTLTAARTMRFELSNLTADADLYLESSTGTVLAWSVRGGTASDTIVHTLEAGTYYVRVDAYAAGTIGYQLRLSQESSPPAEGETRQTAHDLGT